MLSFQNYNKKIWVLYLLLVAFGLLNLYDLDQWFNEDILKTRFFKQSLWFGMSLLIFFFIHFIEADIFDLFAYHFFFISLILIFFTVIRGHTISGHNAWIHIGSFTLQPSEFLKVTCSLMIAKVLSMTKSLSLEPKTLIFCFFVIGISVMSILLQGDLGSAMVFSSFIIPLYIVDIPLTFLFHIGAFIIFFLLLLFFPFKFIFICIIFLMFVSFLFFHKHLKEIIIITLDLMLIAFFDHYIINHALHKYHKDRIKVLFDSSIDKLGLSWNILQSKIAIGNGGLFGRGFGVGTQTKYNFIPAQQTDFIFCTIAEEYGFIGFLIYSIVFFLLIIEMFNVAEKQKFQFNKIFIYSSASILFFHFAINIAMTSGLFPIVGIPLPFISYGGSSFLAFSIMIFITLKLDLKNNNVY